MAEGGGGRPPRGFGVPPHNLDAEKAVLGSIFLNNKVYDDVGGSLKPEHFASTQNAAVYEAVVILIEGGHTADPITLRRFFETSAKLAEIGGKEHLGELAACAATRVNAKEYARLVRDLYLRREIITTSEAMLERAYSGEIEDAAQAQIADAETRLHGLAEAGSDAKVGHIYEHVQVGMAQALAAFEHTGPAGLPTGFTDLDLLLGGMHRTDLLIVAGRTAMGKTALSCNIAFNTARSGVGTLVFSLEMSGDQLAMRELSPAAGYSSHQIRTGRVTREAFDALARAASETMDLPLWVDDRAMLTVSALRTEARRLHRKHKLGLVVVDYLQLLTPDHRRRDSRVQEIGDITRSLKALAKELAIPVLAVSQLSREVEKRDDKRPFLSDLRESGSIEQDADVVMFVYRHEYYLEREEPVQRTNESDSKYAARHAAWQTRLDDVKNTAQVIIAKHRHGPIGTVDMRFDPHTTKFSSLSKRSGQ